MAEALAGPQDGFRLDRSREPWVGSLPELGVVAVGADGTVTVTLAPDCPPAEREERTRALRFGWGEPLSLARRGFTIAAACSAGPSDSPDSVLLCANQAGASQVLLALAEHGWVTLADRITPVSWSAGGLLAHPRDAPVVVAAQHAQRAGWVGIPARADSDAVTVELPRSGTPRPVRGIAAISRRRPSQPTRQAVFGHKRFTIASRLVVGGALAAPTQGGATLARDLRLAEIPMIELAIRSETLAADVDELVAWWSTLAPMGEL